MRAGSRRIAVVLGLVLAGRAAASTPIAVAPDGGIWVVNPDADTVARIDPATATRTGEFPVGRYPRTVAVTSGAVTVACQGDDTIVQLGPTGTRAGSVGLPFGCAPYGIAASPDAARLYVTCEGTGDVLVLDGGLGPLGRVALAWPEPRAVAVAPDGKVYVTHYVTKEPNHTGHVSEIDPTSLTVTRVLAIPPDFDTCETLGTGQGVANLLSAVAVPPAGSAAAGQLWVGGTLHNSLRKGLFERSAFFSGKPGTGVFPDFDFGASPGGVAAAGHRDIYKPAAHDIARSGLWKIDLASGSVAARLDVVGGATVNGIAFSPAGTIAYAVDLMANGFYAFNVGRGSGGNPTSLFGPVAAGGPGGAQPGTACTGDPNAVTAEAPYVLPPQARLVTTGGMQPLSTTARTPVDTGQDYDVDTDAMVPRPDGVGTTPIGVALSADGSEAYVANYLARNVALVEATPAGFACLAQPATACASRADCPGAGECMPLVRAVVPSLAHEPLPAELLDGKILFSTSARDAAGAGSPVPPYNLLTHDQTVHQGHVVSTARDGASLACTSCHADFAGNDGRTWDFSQFGSSLRNTMDLRGRAAFAPGTCSTDASVSCTTDAACAPGGHCVADPNFVPPNIEPDQRAAFFNPMGTTHWNGDRDEVEDFEFTFRELLGASDCDGEEHSQQACAGALVIRGPYIADPADVDPDLAPVPNRRRSPRLDHLGDYVYSLTSFPRNPNAGAAGGSISDAARRGRVLFNDPVVHCAFCHNSTLGAQQQFTDKRPDQTGFDPNQTPRADLNSPFLRHDVGTANVFDQTNPFEIANDSHGLLGFTLFQNEQNQIPGNRGTLNNYLTSVLNDVWNTAPYLHDGSAATLLDVVRPCVTTLDGCTDEGGHGRNVDDLHGATSFLSARQLNDLVAFQKAPHEPVGEAFALNGIRLDVRRLKVHFGKHPQSDSLVFTAGANVPRSLTFDPAGQPVVFSVGVPAGETMRVIEHDVPASAVKLGKGGTSLRFADARGTRAAGLRKLMVQARRGRLVVHATSAKLDLSALKGKAPDVTLGVEIGTTTLGITRRFHANKRGTMVKGP